MALIDEVKKICSRLAPCGWRDLLLQHGLDINAADLKKELTKELTRINRKIKGFEDFAFEGKRGIEPSNPSRSLLFHAFASPNVIKGVNKSTLTAFPTLAEIEIVENYVYGIKPPSVLELQVRAQRQPLAIVVFASEYRPAPETAHRKHADMCFARTGVARVGTAEPLYMGEARGFAPFVEGQPNAFRVLPARYSAYIAVIRKGNKDVSRPMRFQAGDEERNFWVPLHKLFSGKECLRDRNLHVTLQARHVNEKLRRIHLQLEGTGWSEPDISKPPFIFTEGIVEWSKKPEFGTGLLVPIVRPKLIEPAHYKGKLLTYKVPADSSILSSSLEIPPVEGARRAPEYVHARHKITPDGKLEDLNNQPNVADVVAAGGYNALHYLDFTGDGCIEALCPELAVEIARNVPAYSLVTAPDFFPNCDQRELMDWWEQSVPKAIRESIWRIEPEALSDVRMPPNLSLKNADFRQEDTTVSAIVSLPYQGSVRQMQLNVPETKANSYLPDAAAGVFAPGWDISYDRTTEGVEFLASYGLGSPFPEDSKLCAALSTFWPAVSPDAARTFEPNPDWPTVSPLTDEEIGQVGNLSWDGVQGPRMTRVGNKTVVEYSAIDHADYVENALKNKFSLALTGKVEVRQYEARVLTMAYAYQALGATENKGEWAVFSFRKVEPNDAKFLQAQTQTKTKLEGVVYQFLMYRPGEISTHPTDFRKRIVEIKESAALFVSPLKVLLKRGEGAWEVKNV